MSHKNRGGMGWDSFYLSLSKVLETKGELYRAGTYTIPSHPTAAAHRPKKGTV